MTTYNRIVSIETRRVRRLHDVIVAVRTSADAAAKDKRWTMQSVLNEMNSAGRFYTEASNGRQARVQRYTCNECSAEHIRTHIGDGAIHDMMMLPRAAGRAAATT